MEQTSYQPKTARSVPLLLLVITMIINFCYHQSLLTVFSQIPFILIDISSSQESIGLSDVAIEVLHLLLNYLNSCSKKDLDIKPEEEVAFLDSLIFFESSFIFVLTHNLV